MKTGFKLLLVFLLSLFVSACATTGKIPIPDKYALSGELTEVQWIWKTRIMDWEDVDNQSLIIQTHPGTYYLIVLSLPSRELPFRQNRIGISTTSSRIRAGFDRIVIMNEAHMSQSYTIDRIFKIDGSQKMRSIRDQLKGKGTGIEKMETQKMLNGNSNPI